MIQDVVILQESMTHKDSRGVFQRITTPPDFSVVESYISYNRFGVFRGLHLQWGQRKIVICLSGEIQDYILDLRKKSPTYGQLMKLNLPNDAPYGVLIPAGCAHGFSTYTQAVVFYFMDTPYDATRYAGVSVQALSNGCIVSDKDKALPSVSEMMTSLCDI